LKLSGLALVCAIALSVATVAVGNRPNRRHWSHYANARWKFCVDYPSAWTATELQDGSGITLYPHADADSSSSPYLSISGVPDQPDVDNANIVFDDSPPLDLDGNFTRSLESLREYGHASGIRVLEKRPLKFQGFDALRTRIRYRTASNGEQLADDTFWINREYVIFTAVLFGTPRQVRALEPVYRDIVMQRFQLVCSAKR
jgi:hypothetical protein